MAEGHLEVLLNHRPEEVQGEHVEEKMSPSSMYQTITEHPVPLLPMPHIVSVKLKRIDIQLSRETEEADHNSKQYEDKRNHCSMDANILLFQQ
jgi:hypothetical protein